MRVACINVVWAFGRSIKQTLLTTLKQFLDINMKIDLLSTYIKKVKPNEKPRRTHSVISIPSELQSSTKIISQTPNAQTIFC